MSVDRSPDPRPSEGRWPPGDVAPDDTQLHSVVVRYESRPDRRTVAPVGVADHERLTRWLSADDDAFVDLDACR